MEPHNNPYATPHVSLTENSGPPSLDGWSAGQLRLLAWLSLVSAVGSLLLLALALAEGLQGSQAVGRVSDWLSPVLILLGCYLLIQLKRFAEQRFAAQRLVWPVWAVIVCSLLLGVLDVLWGPATSELGWQMLSYFGVLAGYGALLTWLGIRLRQVQNVYPVFNLMAWMDIIGGIMLASIILLVLAMLPLIGANLAMAWVFFKAAAEWRRH